MAHKKCRRSIFLFLAFLLVLFPSLLHAANTTDEVNREEIKKTDNTLKIGAWLQSDVRIYQKDHPGISRFLIRRARLDVRGSLEHDFAYRFYGEFEGATAGSQNAANLKEGWLEWNHFPFFRMRIGQFKEPFSMEATTSARWIDFVERAVGITNLQPAEDLGFMLFGKLLNHRVEYGVGIFNGTATNSAETSDDKDVAGRLVIIPFAHHDSIWLKGLHVGGSATYGKQRSTLDGTNFTTAGGTAFFTYANPTAGNDITFHRFRTRAGGDLEWLLGPASLKGEYLFTKFEDVTSGGTSQDQTVHSYAVQGTYLLTGEEKQRNKPVRPSKNFSLKEGGWGAWELAARYESFKTDQTLIDNGLATGSNQLWAVTGGMNWWFNQHALLKLNYVRTTFDTAIANAGNRDNENMFLMRAQYNF